MQSLQEYVLVASETQSVDLFRRTQSGEWTFIPYAEGDEIELKSVGLTISVNLFYEDVVILPPENAANPLPEDTDSV